MLEKISKWNQVLKGISDIVSISFEDDVIVAYDSEEYLKEAFEANIEYAVAEAVEETTKETTLDIARKMKLKGINISDIMSITGLSKKNRFIIVVYIRYLVKSILKQTIQFICFLLFYCLLFLILCKISIMLFLIFVINLVITCWMC